MMFAQSQSIHILIQLYELCLNNNRRRYVRSMHTLTANVERSTEHHSRARIVSNFISNFSFIVALKDLLVSFSVFASFFRNAANINFFIMKPSE